MVREIVNLNINCKRQKYRYITLTYNKDFTEVVWTTPNLLSWKMQSIEKVSRSMIFQKSLTPSEKANAEHENKKMIIVRVNFALFSSQAVRCFF